MQYNLHHELQRIATDCNVAQDTNKEDPNANDGDSQRIKASQDVTNTMQNE